MSSSNGGQAIGGRGLGPQRALGSLAIAVLLTLAIAGSATLAQSPNPAGPSLAQGHAEVIAHGAALLPRVPVIWRVATQPAQLPRNAPVAGRVLGFVLADRGTFLITDAASGDQTRLAPGEAVFVPDGARQTRASLGSGPAQYVALDLIPAADVGIIGTGRLVYAGDPFTAPRGRHDLDLVRDVLHPLETTSLAATGAPTAIIVTAGSLRVQNGARTETLAAGQAGSFQGDLTLTGTGSGDTAFAAALIGPEIPEPTAPQATAAPAATAPAGTGSLTITTRQCPPDRSVTPSSSLDTLAAVCPVISTGIDYQLTFQIGVAFKPNGPLAHPLTIADATPDADSSFTWNNIPFAAYRVAQTKLPAGTRPLLVSPHLAVPLPITAFVAPAGDPNAPSGQPHQQVNVYDFPTSAVGSGHPGQIAVHVYACPAGQNPGNVNPAACTAPAPPGYDFKLTGGSGGPRTLADAPGGVQGDGFSWFNLDFGTYHLTQTAYDAADGYDAYWIRPGDGISGSPDQGYDLTLSAATPVLQVYVYEFQNATPPATGVIRVTTHLCPPGMTLATLDRGACTVTQQGMDFSLTGNLLPRPYTLADALDAGDGAFAWPQLPFGSYHVAQIKFPGGYTTYWIETSAAVGGGPDIGYDVGIAQESPARDLQVYDFAPAGGTSAAAPAAATSGATVGSNAAQLGDPLIETRDAGSNLGGGACYELTGDGGTIDVCDNGSNDALTANGDPRILLTGIPAATYTVRQTHPPAGAAPAPDQTVTVIAGGAFPRGEAIVTFGP